MLIALAGLDLLPVLVLGAAALLVVPVQIEQFPIPAGPVGLVEIILLSVACGLTTFLLLAVIVIFALVLMSRPDVSG